MFEHTSGYLAARTMLVVGIAGVLANFAVIFIAIAQPASMGGGDRASMFGLPADVVIVGGAGVVLPLLGLGVMYRIYRGAREADETWRSLGR